MRVPNNGINKTRGLACYAGERATMGKRKIKVKSRKGDNYCIKVTGGKDGDYITIVSKRELQKLKKQVSNG